MKPSDLYAREPEKVELVIETYDGDPDGYISGCYYNHVPEVDPHAKYEPTDRVVIKIYKHFDFDHRRYWRLASIWFDDKPIMIVRNAGREGDDFADRFITDQDGYWEMVKHLMSRMIPERDMGGHDFYGKDEDIRNLANFYGNELDGYFERYNF